jgi:hypothetical protein
MATQLLESSIPEYSIAVTIVGWISVRWHGRQEDTQVATDPNRTNTASETGRHDGGVSYSIRPYIVGNQRSSVVRSVFHRGGMKSYRAHPAPAKVQDQTGAWRLSSEYRCNSSLVSLGTKLLSSSERAKSGHRCLLTRTSFSTTKQGHQHILERKGGELG